MDVVDPETADLDEEMLTAQDARVAEAFESLLEAVGDTDENLRLAVTGMHLLWAAGLSDRVAAVMDRIIAPLLTKEHEGAEELNN